MTQDRNFEVIIIGGSYAGLSAALALGRSLRKVLVIDHKQPCNQTTPHSQNFLTQDGKAPAEIAALALEQVKAYPSVAFLAAEAVHAEQLAAHIRVDTAAGEQFFAKKLILASGIKDAIANIPGFAASWGKTVIHCPYCHGYEFKNQPTGILANGDKAMHLAALVHNLSQDLRIYTNGPKDFTAAQLQKLSNAQIPIIETELLALNQQDGILQEIQLQDGTHTPLTALYAPLPFSQHSAIPALLGCAMTESGHIQVDKLQQTSVPNVYACGDNSSAMRAVAQAVATGNVAGAVVNMALTQDSFGEK